MQIKGTHNINVAGTSQVGQTRGNNIITEKWAFLGKEGGADVIRSLIVRLDRTYNDWEKKGS